MKIEIVNLKLLHNNEHLQFQIEFKEVVEKHTAKKLKIEAVYAEWVPLYDNECVAIDKILKSTVTEVITDADVLRDTTFSGMRETVSAATKHFRPVVKQAATRLMVVFDHFGNLAVKTYDDETNALNNLIDELNTSGAADVATVGISEWITELKANNDAFVALMHARYDEQTTKTSLNAARELCMAGIGQVVVTLGKAGAILVSANESWVAHSPEIKVVSSVGSGDSFLGGLAFALANGFSPEIALNYAVGAGSANALHIGGGVFSYGEFEKIYQNIKL